MKVKVGQPKGNLQKPFKLFLQFINNVPKNVNNITREINKEYSDILGRVSWNTTAKYLRILEQRKIIKSKKVGKTIVWFKDVDENENKDTKHN